MSRVGRNQPCPCGSGRKTKRCCGIQRGPAEPDLAKARLAHHAMHAARTLSHLPDHRLLELFRELPDLPEHDLTLVVELPELVSPELARLYRAIADDDIDHAEELLPAVLVRIDTPQTRARLADAIADLHAAGRLDPMLAAAAHIDLDSRHRHRRQPHPRRRAGRRHHQNPRRPTPRGLTTAPQTDPFIRGK